MVTVTVDAKGRLSIPAEIRSALDIVPGDILFLETDREHKVLHLAKAVNPFDGLAEHVEREYREGRTRSLRAYAAEQAVDLDDE